MLKFLLIVILIFYVLYRIGGFFFRMLIINAQQRTQQNQNTSYQSRGKDGNIHIDYVPKQTKSKSDFKGGDYVDYEEVK